MTAETPAPKSADTLESPGGKKGGRSWIFRIIAITSVAAIAVFYSPLSFAGFGKRGLTSRELLSGKPQDFVACTGWHALCSASPDCKRNGDKASCDCMRVNETHIVATSEIQDTAVKRLTYAQCTDEQPCDVDQAPVCNAIRDRQYQVDNVRYDWVSTYSYRGWCSLLKQNLKPCDQRAPGYSGDSSWAVCDAAPCTENQNPSDPDRPLTCQCRVVENAPFVGMKGSCTGDNGGIMSSFPLSAWDFQNDTYPFPMPGYEYVRGACAPLKSDRAP